MTRRARIWQEFAHHAEANADGCPDDAPYGVVNDDTGEVVQDGCYATQGEAADAATALDSAATAAPEVPFTAVIAIEGFETGDGRVLDPGGWNQSSQRMLPLPAWVLDEQSAWGHEGAFVGGRAVSMSYAPDGRRIIATGFLDVSTERGQYVESQIRAQNLRFVSIDVGDADVEYEVREVEADGWPTDVMAHFTSYEIMGFTICAEPAIAWAVIWFDDMEPPAEFTAALPAVQPRVEEPVVVDTGGSGPLLIASGADAPPPIELFERSGEHDALVARVRDEGMAPHVMLADEAIDGLYPVRGYIAPFGVCHTGLPGCVTAPHSPTDYSFYATLGYGVQCCSDCPGDHAPDTVSEHSARALSVGTLTMGTTHAELNMTPTRARLHYEDTGYQVARVAVGEDDFGIWFAGLTMVGLSDERLAMLQGSNISGDWRLLRGNLELVAALVVNVPGFPMVSPGSHLAASGVQTALISPAWPGLDALAAGGRRTKEDPRWAAMHRRLTALDRELAVLRPLAAEELSRRVHPADA